MLTESVLETWMLAFLAGVYTPLGAVCVLPLYPGYLAFLTGQASKDKRISPLLLGLVVTSGVISGMLLFGLVFVYILELSTSSVIGVLGPVIYLLLAIFSIGMIAGIDIGRIFPRIHTPMTDSPILSAWLFGGFFGLVALPCNPASIIMVFALSTTTVNFISNMWTFIIFGFGMAVPLLILSLLSSDQNRYVIGFLTGNHRAIQIIAGLIMLGIALYYLIFVFVHELL
ncbi:MAG: hypothetical protein JXA44_13360 [Methanospirillaceae archaeon]|nr:hypothetical protein [Methanospirillaceae archaeon]